MIAKRTTESAIKLFASYLALTRYLRWAILFLTVLSAAAAPQQRQATNPQKTPPRAALSGAPDIAALQKGFTAPPSDSRIMMRWWWFGPAVTKTQLEREMKLMKEGGIGGFEVQPVYPVALDDPATGIRTIPFLSDEFIDILRFTSQKARELGLRMDLTVGSGWPYGGPQVPVSQSAGKLRIQRAPLAQGIRRVPIPDIGAGEKLLAIYLAPTREKTIVGDGLRELSEIAEGAVRVPGDSEGPHEVIFFISSHTGQMVKRPALGAEGFVLNHYDRAAVDNYQRKVGDRLMQAFGQNPPYAIFCDSLEVYESDWTSDLLEEFQKRRGYDLKPHLPALLADVGPKTADIRHDWGRTLTELLNERFMVPMRDWARKNRTRFRIQGYGIPPATISTNQYADLSEGEGAQWKILRAARWASSANHLFGRAVTSSETWTWLHSPSFRATPLDVKAESDLHFLQGVNQLIGHGWPYTAEGVEYPGWRFYAAGVFNDKNPWWIVMPDLSLYLQRLSYLLRQGSSANDVALYLPNSDAWSSFTAGGRVHMIETLRERIGPHVVAKVLESGFNLDFFDDEALKQIGHIEKGALALGTCKYKAVILPNVERVPPETMMKLEQYVRAGGVLIASRRLPALAPGFKATDAEHHQVGEISRRLFEGATAPAHFINDESRDLGNKLSALLRPDVSLAPPSPEIGFVHRSTPDAEIYFLANTANTRQSVKATFRVQGIKAEGWDPMSGKVAAVEAQDLPGGISIPLDLEPYSSRVFLFSKRTLPPSPAPKAGPTPAPLDLSTQWQVTFGRDGKPRRMDTLSSWTENEETRFFSGQVIYEKNLPIPASLLQDGLKLRLDFGEGQPVPGQRPDSRVQAWLDAPIREAAVVYINGRRAGAVWCPPFSLDISGLLTPGANIIRVVTGNLAINHLAGRALPDYRLLNLRYGVRFEPQDMKDLKPLPAGLLGPIRLLPSR